MLSCECGKTFAKPAYPVYCRCGLTHYPERTVGQCEPPDPPYWVQWLQARRAPEDTGVGDTFARLLGVGGEVFKAATKAVGIPCGCTARQAEWNRRWPYEKAP